jgi:hypothetical protein
VNREKEISPAHEMIRVEIRRHLVDPYILGSILDEPTKLT